MALRLHDFMALALRFVRDFIAAVAFAFLALAFVIDCVAFIVFAFVAFIAFNGGASTASAFIALFVACF